MNHRSLEELASWAEKARRIGKDGRISYGLRRFGKPHPGFWPENLETIHEMVTRVEQALDEADRCAFHAFCLASGLMAPKPDKILKALPGSFHPEKVGLPCCQKTLNECRWMCLPVPLLNDRRGCIVYIFLGVGSGNQVPFKCQTSLNSIDFLDSSAREAVRLAADLAGIDHYIFWIPQFFELPVHIRGSSLGLPVYLGFRLLEEGCRTWPELVATGRLGPSGKVLPVDGLEQKLEAAQDAGYTGFIYPCQNKIHFSDILGNHFDLIPVPDTDTALAVAQCHIPGSGNAQVTFYRNRRNIETVINTIGSAGFSMLQYLENREQFLSNFVRSQTSACSRQKDLLARMEGYFRNYSLEEFSCILNHLFPAQEVKNLIDTSPIVAWQAIGLHIRLANHQGLIRKFQIWEKLARDCLEVMIKEKEIDEDHLLLGIYSIISGYHNQYDFSPSICQETMAAFSPVIGKLEKNWHLRRKQAPYAVAKILGAYYGTMAQHFGFCGPAWHKQSENYICKALEAFGSGKYAPCQPDWQRVFSYRFFCSLDAGDTEQACDALKSYLGADLREISYNHLKNPFEHFLLARYLAESNSRDIGYINWVQQNKIHKKLPKNHPWPLWALNMGRLQNNPEWKTEFFKLSLHLCRQNRGPTIRIMGLMPLARMAHENLVRESFLKKHINEILDECHDSGLNQKHFEPLWNLPWHEVAKVVLDRMPHYFPFSYR